MSTAIDHSKILFYEEKKAVIVNILDTAVKTLEFAQKDYIDVKSQLMHAIEAPGNERTGLDKIVALTNMMISKVAKHSGYVIVEEGKEELAEHGLPTEAADPGSEKTTTSAAESAPKSSAPSHGFHQASVSLQKRKTAPKTREPDIRGKEGLLRLMNFLPPLISRKEIELLSARVRAAKLGPATGSSPARTTGDLEREMVAQVREEYGPVFQRMVKENPKAFIETIELASGRTREEDVSEKLQKQLRRVHSLAEFLSVRDLVERQVKEYEKSHSQKPEKNGNSLFFWRKK